MAIKIAPSILSADFSCLGDSVKQAIEAGADAIHVDVMDGHFVPNMTAGPLLVASLSPICQAANIPIDVHLMVKKPERLIPEFARAGANILTVHVETCPHLQRTIHQIKSEGVKASVTLNPATPLVMIEEILPDVDQVLIMSVNPGFGGQAFLPGSLERISKLHHMLIERELIGVDIEVDGGIVLENVDQVAQAGATILVIGSAIFNTQATIANNLAALRNAVKNY